jgi:hypothetical protein
MLFAVARFGRDALVLVLAQNNGRWTAIGLVRR